RNYDGRIQVGELICNAAIAQDLLSIFRELFQNKYQIYSMYLVEEFWTGDALTTDEASVRANNTSAFNYRRASDAGNLSNHAYGRAVDVNPRHNPYVVQRESGWYADPEIDYDIGEDGYVDPATRPGRLHAMTAGDLCVQTFKKYGFTWGGDLTGQSRDYQHFERK
ncbi:MAG: M15 family metallopeptidase, partial [Lachnospiraceae bacterium]